MPLKTVRGLCASFSLRKKSLKEIEVSGKKACYGSRQKEEGADCLFVLILLRVAASRIENKNGGRRRYRLLGEEKAVCYLGCRTSVSGAFGGKRKCIWCLGVCNGKTESMLALQ